MGQAGQEQGGSNQAHMEHGSPLPLPQLRGQERTPIWTGMGLLTFRHLDTGQRFFSPLKVRFVPSLLSLLSLGGEGRAVPRRFPYPATCTTEAV